MVTKTWKLYSDDNMKFTEVKSSTVRAIAYESNVLYVEFRSGGVYKFDNISNMQYLNFLNAKSKGKHFAETIKKFSEKHPAVKLTKEEAANIKL